MATNDINITSSDAVVVLTVEDLYPNGIVLQQFSTDAAVAADAQQIAEVRMGVDGYLAAGVVHNLVPVTVTLEANSPSKAQLDNVLTAMRTNKKPYLCNMTVKLNSTGDSYVFKRGVLQSGTSMPAIQRVLGPTTWTFNFESCEKN